MLNKNYQPLLENKTSRYSLVRAVAKRAREITQDDVTKELCGDEKPVSYALDEFLSGKLEIIEPEEIRNI